MVHVNDRDICEAADNKVEVNKNSMGPEITIATSTSNRWKKLTELDKIMSDRPRQIFRLDMPGDKGDVHVTNILKLSGCPYAFYTGIHCAQLNVLNAVKSVTASREDAMQLFVNRPNVLKR